MPSHCGDVVAAHLDAGLGVTRNEMSTMRGDLRNETVKMGADLRTEIASVRADLRTEMGNLGAGLRTEMANMRADLIKWMFLFWLGNAGLTLGLAFFGPR